EASGGSPGGGAGSVRSTRPGTGSAPTSPPRGWLEAHDPRPGTRLGLGQALEPDPLIHHPGPVVNGDRERQRLEALLARLHHECPEQGAPDALAPVQGLAPPAP